jgi:hypothetical protein
MKLYQYVCTSFKEFMGPTDVYNLKIIITIISFKPNTFLSTSFLKVSLRLLSDHCDY